MHVDNRSECLRQQRVISTPDRPGIGLVGVNPGGEFRVSSGGLLLLALATGAGAGLFAVVFPMADQDVHACCSPGYSDYAAVAGAPRPGLEGMGRWFLVATPVIAGLLYGPLVHFFAREARGHGVPR